MFPLNTITLTNLLAIKSSLGGSQHNYLFRYVFQVPLIFFREQVDHISPKEKVFEIASTCSLGGGRGV